MTTAIRLLKQERTTAKYLSILIVGFYLVALVVALVPKPENLTINILNSDRFAFMSTTASGTVWNVGAGMMGALVLASFVTGIVHAGFARTYLGAGATRRSTFMMYGLFATVWTCAATGFVALTWAIAAMFDLPHIEGVSFWSLLLIPVTYFSLYFLGLGISMPFVRFTWWKVAIVGVLTYVVILFSTLGITRMTRGVSYVHLDPPNQLVAILLTITVGALGAAVAYLAHRNLPIRRG